MCNYSFYIYIGNVGTSIENQDLHIGGTSQVTERNVLFNASAGMKIGKSKLNLNYSQSNHALNNSQNQKQIWATYGLQF